MSGVSSVALLGVSHAPVLAISAGDTTAVKHPPRNMLGEHQGRKSECMRLKTYLQVSIHKGSFLGPSGGTWPSLNFFRKTIVALIKFAARDA